MLPGSTRPTRPRWVEPTTTSAAPVPGTKSACNACGGEVYSARTDLGRHVTTIPLAADAIDQLRALSFRAAHRGTPCW